MVFSYSQYIREQTREEVLAEYAAELTKEKESAIKKSGDILYDLVIAKRLVSLGVSLDIIEEVTDLSWTLIERIQENLARKTSTSD